MKKGVFPCGIKGGGTDPGGGGNDTTKKGRKRSRGQEYRISGRSIKKGKEPEKPRIIKKGSRKVGICFKDPKRRRSGGGKGGE